MRALLCRLHGGPDDLSVEEVASPTPGPGEVLIDVYAAGLNFPDLLVIAGRYQVQPSLPFAPGMEASGVVAGLGEGVTGLRVGDRVMASTGHGGLAEQVSVPAQDVYPIPEGVRFEQAACFPIVYGTSDYALRDRAALAPGETLLVHGAAGGVGLTAVELGRKMGARVIGTVGSDDKIDVVKAAGADHVFNASEVRVRDVVKALTDDRGADVIYDPVGGDLFDESLRCVNWGGRILVVGFASGRIPEPRMNLVLLKGCQIVGVFWGAWRAREPAACRARFDELLDWTARGDLRPHISLRLPLHRAVEGLHAIAARRTTGKVVVQIRAD